jgi:hypothetical protein
VFKSIYFGTLYAGHRINDFKYNGIVDMNIGRSNKYNGLQMSNNIGLIQGVFKIDGNKPVATSDIVYYPSIYYSSTTSDNNSFSIDYPSNNQITISLNKFDNSLLPYMSGYCLFLTLTGILDNEIDKSY